MLTFILIAIIEDAMNKIDRKKHEHLGRTSLF